jgi:protein-disulfide isomerase
MRGILAVLGGVMFSLAATFTAQAEVSTTYHELVEGNPKAKLTVVEYASLTCPHCAKFYVESFPKLKKDYIDTGKIRFVFRDLPTPPRELAFAAAKLARCAPEGRGLGLIEMMYKHQEEWMQNPQVTLMGYAQLSGITSAEFDACLKNQPISDAMNKSIDQASRDYKVESTPTFFVGETKVSGETYEPLQKAIDKALADEK